MSSSVEDIAIRAGSYVPRGAGAGGGGSYFSGSLRLEPGKAGSNGPPAAARPRDEYIPSNPPLSAAGDAQDTDEGGAGAASGEFTPEEQRAIAELKNIDRKVRAHEQAHISVGGSYILGGAAFEYESGPDQRRYAVGGEVSIDSSPVRDNPEATIAKMQVVRAAALAPADPSAQDRVVASAASREEGRARGELGEIRAAEARGDGDDPQTNARTAADAAAAYASAAAPQTPGVNFAA